MMLNTMLKTLQATEVAVRGAGDALTKAKLVPGDAVASMNDMMLKNPDQFGKEAPGSLIKLTKSGVDSYAVLPTGVVLLSGGAGDPKLTLVEKWSVKGSNKSLAQLATMGISGIVPGVLTMGGQAGSAAANLKAGLLPIELGVPTVPGPAVASVNVKLGGSATNKGIEEALKLAKLEWRPWAGASAGLGATPTGDGLPSLADARAATVDSAKALGEQHSNAVLAAAALTAIKFAADAGSVPIGDLAELMEGLSGVEGSANFFAVLLATTGDDTEARKAVAVPRRAVVDALARLLCGLDSETCTAIAAENDRFAALGVTLNSTQQGGLVRAAVEKAASETAQAKAAAAKAATDVVDVDATPPPKKTSGGGGVAASTDDELYSEAETRMQKLGLSSRAEKYEAVTKIVEELRASNWSPRGSPLPFSLGAATTPPREDSGGANGTMAVLRPKGAEALTSAQLLGELARELGKPAADLAEALASARGAGARPAALLNVFSASSISSMDRAAKDFDALFRLVDDATSVTFDGPPASWREAVERLEYVVIEGQRAAQATTTTTTEKPSPPAAGEGGRLHESAYVTLSKASTKSIARGTSAASNVAMPAAEESFARAEQVASRGADPLTEASRLTSMPDPLGQANWALIYHDGTIAGNLPRKGQIAAPSDNARAGVLEWIRMAIEHVVSGGHERGQARVTEVSDEIDRLGLAVQVLMRSKTCEGPGAIPDTEALFPLSTKLLGGTPPAEEASVDADVDGRGRWGQISGEQSKVDIPTAMGALAPILAAVHCTAGGAPLGLAQAGSGSGGWQVPSKSDGFGLTALARQACGTLSDARVRELFDWVFAQASEAARKRRTRPGSAPPDFAKIVREAKREKLEPLKREQQAFAATDRRLAERDRAKSPRRDEDEGGEEGAGAEKKRRRGKPTAAPRSEGTGAAALADKFLADLATEKGQKPPPPPPPPPAGDGARGAKLAPNSISKLVDRDERKGAVEVLQALYVSRHPNRASLTEQPCPFLAIKGCCEKPPGATRKACVQCEAQASKSAAEKAPAFSAEMLKAVKAACSERVQAAFKR